MREGRSITNAASILDQLGMKRGHFSSPKKPLNFAFGDIFLTQVTTLILKIEFSNFQNSSLNGVCFVLIRLTHFDATAEADVRLKNCQIKDLKLPEYQIRLFLVLLFEALEITITIDAFYNVNI